MSKEFFLVFAEDKVGAIKLGRCPFIVYTQRKDLKKFYQNMREDYPDYQIRPVKDKALEDKLRQRVKQDAEIIKATRTLKNQR